MTNVVKFQKKRDAVIELATKHGYNLMIDNPELCMLRFIRPESRNNIKIDVWYSTMTAGLYRKHNDAIYSKDNSLEDIDNLLKVYADA